MNHYTSGIFRLLLLLMVLLAAPLPVTASPSSAATKTTLVAVIPPDFPPTYFRDPKTGQAAGLAVDLTNLIAQHAGLTISYRFASPWETIEEMLRTGEADLIPLRVMTPKTRQEFLFTSALDTTAIHYFARVTDQTQRPGPQTRIGVVRGSGAHDYLKKHPELPLLLEESLEHQLIDLISGQADLILAPKPNLLQLADRLGLADRIRVLQPPAYEVKRGFAFRPGDEQLRDRFNQSIQVLHDSPGVIGIYKKWLGKPKPYWTARRTAMAAGGLLALISVLFTVWHNLTLHRTNQRLQAEQTFLQTIIDAIPDFIFFKDKNSLYLGCNRAFAEQMHTRSRETLVGLSDFELQQSSELATYFNRTDREAMESGNTVKFEVSLPFQDQKQRQLEVIKTPFHNKTGQIMGVIGVARDITERHRYQQELEEARQHAESANRAKTQFLANMSHEIRTPLNGVLGVAQLLAMSDLTQEQHEYLALLQSSGESLLAILNDILDLTKIEADMLQLAPEPFSLTELLESVAKLHRHLCRQKGLALILESSPDLPAAVIGDPLRIKQILFNLLGNAVKFTHQGSVSLRCQVMDSSADQITLQFQVCDTGIGISQEDQERIFRPFEQADSSNTRKYGGTGLGLAICQRLTRLMGGSLSLESTPGQGSCFMLSVAFTPALLDQTDSSRQTDDQSDAGTRTPLTILVAEDNDINRFFVAKLVRQMGHQALEAENGRQALELLSHQPCDLVVLDIQMPVLDGTQTLQEIRKQDALLKRHTPVIALTAHAMSDDQERFLQQGFDDYLSKPLRIHSLAAIISKLSRKSAAA